MFFFVFFISQKIYNYPNLSLLLCGISLCALSFQSFASVFATAFVSENEDFKLEYYIAAYSVGVGVTLVLIHTMLSDFWINR